MAAELDIKARLDASALLDTLDAMGVAPKNPRVKSAVKAAARDIMNAGKSRLSSRVPNSSGLAREMKVVPFRNGRGALIGFGVPDHGTDPATKWKAMRPWVWDRGTADRRNRRGPTGRIKASWFWRDTAEADGPRAVREVVSALAAVLDGLTR